MRAAALALASLALSACAGATIADGVEGALLTHRPDFRACYENANSSARGKVVAAFTIEADGKVSQTSVQNSTLLQPIVEACVLKTIRGIEFPASKSAGTTAVTYPFNFNPN